MFCKIRNIFLHYDMRGESTYTKSILKRHITLESAKLSSSHVKLTFLAHVHVLKLLHRHTVNIWPSFDAKIGSYIQQTWH